MSRESRPRVRFQPQTYRALQRGVHQIAAAVSPTLGPNQRHVAIERAGYPPELLDNGGLIARRIIALSDPDDDMGAMYLRSVLWRTHEEIGDGTATTAILFKAIFDAGVRYVTAGGNAMQLRQHLEAGLRVILDQLGAQARPLEGHPALVRLALGACGDPELAGLLADAFDVMGEYGRVEIRKSQSHSSWVEYVQGSYWDGKLWSPHMATDRARQRADLHDAAIVISDLAVTDPDQLLPILRLAQAEALSHLVIVVADISDKALSLIHYANRQSPNAHIIVVKLAGLTGTDATSQKVDLEDLAVLTGGRVFLAAVGDSFASIQPDDVGHARRVWADKSFVGIAYGKGWAQSVRDQIHQLQKAYPRQDTQSEKRATRTRIGRLLGGSATIWVGGTTERAIDARKDVALRAVNAMRHALDQGIVPGGGVAFLNCQPALAAARAASTDANERAAYRILHEALATPLQVLLHNASLDRSVILARIAEHGDGYGCDVTTGEIVAMQEAGIWDATVILAEAVRQAVTGASLLLTTDTLVHRAQPEQVMTPH